ncbi:MAG: PAS domain-containing protein, partial [Spirochaetia bacterium]|nr:PAS domain-containing protein [Spirochaetia bacterium]
MAHEKENTENKNKEVEELKAQVEAISRSQGTIEFEMDGTVITANDNFLKVLGYTLDEIKGKHHRMFVDAAYASSPEYKSFWDKLNRGEFDSAEYKRIGKGGREVWIQASYNPVLDAKGRPYKVIKFASDVTAAKNKMAAEARELKARIAIMDTTSIVSEADLKGDITYINDKFCEVSQYHREELIGKPHSFVRHPDMPKEVFKELWSTIGRGQIFRGKIKNRKKDGSPYYVDAVIAPVIGENGKPSKYIGVRYEITAEEIERQRMKGLMDAIDSSYAFIEFEVNGNIISAN